MWGHYQLLHLLFSSKVFLCFVNESPSFDTKVFFFRLCEFFHWNREFAKGADSSIGLLDNLLYSFASSTEHGVHSTEYLTLVGFFSKSIDKLKNPQQKEILDNLIKRKPFISDFKHVSMLESPVWIQLLRVIDEFYVTGKSENTVVWEKEES